MHANGLSQAPRGNWWWGGAPHAALIPGALCRLRAVACLLALFLSMPDLHARDGEPDLTFGEAGVLLLDLPFRPLTSLAQPNGSLLLGGQHLNTGRAMLLRLLPDGQLDSSFGDGGYAVLPDLPGLNLVPAERLQFSRLAFMGDGRVVAAGSISSHFSISVPERRCALVALFDEDGTLQTSFGDGGATCVGTAISHFTTDPRLGRAPALAVTDSGIVVGEVHSQAGTTIHWSRRLFRLHVDGSLDTSFGTDGSAAFADGSGIIVASVVEDADGRILVGTPEAVARLGSNGALDLTHGEGGISWVVPPPGWMWFQWYGAAAGADGGSTFAGVLHCWDDCPLAGQNRSYSLALRLADGTPEPQPGGETEPVAPGVIAWASPGDLLGQPIHGIGGNEGGMLQQRDGRLLLLGHEILRLNANGSRDCDFGQGGLVDTGWMSQSSQTLAISPDNRLWLVRRNQLSQPGDPQHGVQVRKYVIESIFGDGFQVRPCGD